MLVGKCGHVRNGGTNSAHRTDVPTQMDSHQMFQPILRSCPLVVMTPLFPGSCL